MRAEAPYDLTTSQVPLGELQTHPSNARVGNVEAIKVSLRASGQYRPIVTARGVVLAGNHTLKAARELGWDTIAAVALDIDPEGDEARRIMLADNRTAELGTYDDRALLDLLKTMDDLDGTGFDDKDVKALEDLFTIIDTNPDGDPDSTPEPDEGPSVSEQGDVWLLGPHRVVCGSSADKDVAARALGGATIDLMVTDPPYGIGYTRLGNWRDKNAVKSTDTISNDDTDVLPLLTDSFTIALASMREGSQWYHFCPSNEKHLEHRQVWRDLGHKVDGLVWVKNFFSIGGQTFHRRHEPVLYGYLPPVAEKTWNGHRTQDDIFEYDKPKDSEEHPTMKPVLLLQELIGLSSRKGETVYDPFLGSGSTLIAADRLGRTCIGIELEPKYVDVICRRYQEQTGIIPIRESDGSAVSFLVTQEV